MFYLSKIEQRTNTSSRELACYYLLAITVNLLRQQLVKYDAKLEFICSKSQIDQHTRPMYEIGFKLTKKTSE